MLPVSARLRTALATAIAAAFVVVTLSCGTGGTPVPPVAKTVPERTEIHGVVLTDPYRWMRNRDDAEVIAYLEEENAFTGKVMEPTAALRKTLYEEMVARIQQTDLSVPVRLDGWLYYSRQEEGKQYPIHCRRNGSMDAPEEILLDGNLLAGDSAYFHLGAYRASPDHSLLAYTVDLDGSEKYILRVKDLATGELLPDTIGNASPQMQWGNDGRTIFYLSLDETRRPYRVHRHLLGEDPAGDRLLYEEEDQAYYLNLTKTKSKQYILVTGKSSVTSEVRYLDADRPGGDFRLFRPREQGVEYAVEHHGDRFYVVTNKDAVNFKLVAVPAGGDGRRNLREVIPHREEVKLDRVELFRDHMVVYERTAGLRTIRIRDLKTGEYRPVTFPEPVYTVAGELNPEFDATLFRFKYSSLLTPPSIFDYDMNTGERTLLKEEPVLGGYDRTLYATERIHAVAEDGTSVPISLAYRKDLRREEGNPALLYGYGSYGYSSEPSFRSYRISLLDRGFVYAVGHVRGGGEMGRRWYLDGKLLNKRNTFTDFIACAEHLVEDGYTSPERLAIRGGSAGGLLVGAAVNMRPDLFGAVVAEVPFVDVMTTMLDPTIPLTVIEWEEWGNPNEKEYFEYMLSYSPYDNVAAVDYPHTLITAGLNDPRVGFWEPAKWTAKLRAAATGDNLLLLKTHMGAGHGGASGRYDILDEEAFVYAFLLHALDVED